VLRVLDRRGAGQDVALHVAAGRERREVVLVEVPDHHGEVLLVDPVELELLAGRDPERAVAHQPRQLVADQVLMARHPAADHADPDHHHVRLLLLLLLQPQAPVAVVLQVGAVELEDLAGILGEEGLVVEQLLGHHPAEVGAGGLQGLVLAELGRTAIRLGHDRTS